MTQYEKIYDYAVDNYYFITSNKARNIGIPNIELVKLAKRGKLNRVGYGVYRLDKYIPSENDPYALAVNLVDAEACVYGESVLSLLNLCPTNPKVIYISTNKRIRKNIPDNINIVKKANSTNSYYEGIKIQNVNDAIESCIGNILPDRLILAMNNAKEQGYITKSQATKLRRKIEHQNEKT